MADKKQPTSARVQPNRVWIELEAPRKLPNKTRDPAHAEEIALRANNMLQRLNPGHDSKFWWSAHEATWCYGNTMGYRVLNDRGEWFSLDYMGRNIEPQLSRIIDLERKTWELEQRNQELQKGIQELVGWVDRIAVLGTKFPTIEGMTTEPLDNARELGKEQHHGE